MCNHSTVKCLSCGAEGSPAHFLASKSTGAKADAARENGKKGGRPRKVKNPPTE